MIQSTRPLLSLAIGSLALALAAPGAMAQPQPDAPPLATAIQAQSRTLFQRARALSSEGKWAEACPLFQEAHDLNATGGTALQLANCYERIDDFEKARRYYRFILDHRADEKVTERITIAEERLAALEPKRSDPDRAPDPAGNGDGNGGDGNGDGNDGGGAARAAGIVVLGVGGVGLAVGTVFGALALSQAGDVKDQCMDSICPTDQRGEADAAMSKGWVSNVAFGVGIVAVATGALILLLSPSSTSSAARRSPATVGLRGLRVRF